MKNNKKNKIDRKRKRKKTIVEKKKRFVFFFQTSNLYLIKQKYKSFLKLIYDILGFVRLRWSWSSFSSIRPVIRLIIHPSKFLIPEEEDDGRGGGKTLVVLQFAKTYKLISKN